MEDLKNIINSAIKQLRYYQNKGSLSRKIIEKCKRNEDVSK